MFSETHRWSSF